MSTTVYTTRPMINSLRIAASQKEVQIATLELPGGAYVVFAKLVVVTIFAASSGFSAQGDFSLEAPGVVDTAKTTLWYSSEPDELEPATTLSLQLSFEDAGVAAHSKVNSAVEKHVPRSTVYLKCRSIRGTLEIKDIVITAIRVDSIINLP
jgi:hypothetical protein